MNAEQMELLELLDAGANHVVLIVDDILNFSAIESGSFPLASEPLDLSRGVVEPAWRMVHMNRAYQEKIATLKLRKLVAPGVPGAIMGDAARLVQVVTNLVSNSIKFTPEGGSVDLELRVSKKPPASYADRNGPFAMASVDQFARRSMDLTADEVLSALALGRVTDAGNGHGVHQESAAGAGLSLRSGVVLAPRQSGNQDVSGGGGLVIGGLDLDAEMSQARALLSRLEKKGPDRPLRRASFSAFVARSVHPEASSAQKAQRGPKGLRVAFNGAMSGAREVRETDTTPRVTEGDGAARERSPRAGESECFGPSIATFAATPPPVDRTGILINTAASAVIANMPRMSILGAAGSPSFTTGSVRSPAMREPRPSRATGSVRLMSGIFPRSPLPEAALSPSAQVEAWLPERASAKRAAPAAVDGRASAFLAHAFEGGHSADTAHQMAPDGDSAHKSASGQLASGEASVPPRSGVRPSPIPSRKKSSILAAPVDSDLWLHIIVHDTGIGLAPDSLERIFEPFLQADLSTVRRFRGTGLGLTICRSLARSMGGDMTAFSTGLGLGSTFTFTIPCVSAGDQLDDGPVAPLGATATTSHATAAAFPGSMSCLVHPAATQGSGGGLPAPASLVQSTSAPGAESAPMGPRAGSEERRASAGKASGSTLNDSRAMRVNTVYGTDQSVDGTTRITDMMDGVRAQQVQGGTPGLWSTLAAPTPVFGTPVPCVRDVRSGGGSSAISQGTAPTPTPLSTEQAGSPQGSAIPGGLQSVTSSAINGMPGVVDRAADLRPHDQAPPSPNQRSAIMPSNLRTGTESTRSGPSTREPGPSSRRSSVPSSPMGLRLPTLSADGPRRLLCAEDDKMSQIVMRRILSKIGCGHQPGKICPEESAASRAAPRMWDPAHAPPARDAASPCAEPSPSISIE